MAKALTKWQEKKAVVRAKKGWAQERIALSLKVSKERVGIALRAKGVGKRRKDTGDTFWGSVKAVQEATGFSWKRARKTIYHAPKWSKKRATRAGKKFKSWREFWDEAEEAALSREEKEQKLEDELDEFYFDTPL